MSTILLCFDEEMLSEAQVAEVKEVAPEANVVRTRDENQIEAILHDLEVAAGWVPREQVLKAPGLRWMQQWWSGADWVLRSEGKITSPFGQVCVLSGLVGWWVGWLVSYLCKLIN